MGTTADKLSYLAEAKADIKAAIEAKGQTVSQTAALKSYAASIGSISNDATAAAGNILSGKTAYSGGGKITGTMTNKAGTTGSAESLGYLPGGGYTYGANVELIEADPLEPTGRTNIHMIPPAGYYDGSTAKLKLNLWGVAPPWVASGTSVGYPGSGVVGTYTSDATAAAGNILSGKTAYVNGVKLTGSMADLSGKTSASNYVSGTFRSGGTGYIFSSPAAGYCGSGTYIRTPVSNLSAGNIKSGVNVGGVVGSYDGTVTYTLTLRFYSAVSSPASIKIYDRTGLRFTSGTHASGSSTTVSVSGPMLLVESASGQTYQYLGITTMQYYAPTSGVTKLSSGRNVANNGFYAAMTISGGAPQLAFIQGEYSSGAGWF